MKADIFGGGMPRRCSATTFWVWEIMWWGLWHVGRPNGTFQNFVWLFRVGLSLSHSSAGATHPAPTAYCSSVILNYLFSFLSLSFFCSSSLSFPTTNFSFSRFCFSFVLFNFKLYVTPMLHCISVEIDSTWSLHSIMLIVSCQNRCSGPVKVFEWDKLLGKKTVWILEAFLTF